MYAPAFRTLLSLTVALTALPCALASADVVHFKGGDRLQGTVVSMSGGKLVLDDTVAGRVTVPLAQVRTLQTAAPVEVVLGDGNVIRDALLPGEDGFVNTAGASTLPAQRLALTSLHEFNPEPVAWHGRVSGGFELARGNTDRDSSHAAAEATRESESDRFALGAGYLGEREATSSSGHTTTERELYARGQWDHFFGPRLYGYLNSRAEKDGVADLDLRFIAGTGLGYRVIKNETSEFDVEAGLNWVSEHFSRGDDEDYLAARFAWSAEHALSDVVHGFHRLEWFPSLEDSHDHLVKTETGLRARLSGPWFGEAKLLWKWDSTPADDAERQDITYLLGAGFEF